MLFTYWLWLVKMQRFNVYLGECRTTVSVVDVLVDLLSIKLCCEAGTNKSKSVVNDWIQNLLHEDNDPYRQRLSQFIQRKIIMEISDKKIIRQYESYLDSA